jgi:hypothetical protein
MSASDRRAIIPLVGECDFVGERYTIRTIQDLYKIPPDKLEPCLVDVMACIKSHKELAQLSGVAFLPLEEIEWFDDGKHDLAIKIEDPLRQRSDN